ncbi:MAG: benzoate-CoA ligase family protein, partial [Desulfobacterales bacterium]
LKSEQEASTQLEEEIKTFVRDRIAVYKYPRWIEFTDRIPKTSGGKIQRFVLQEQIKAKG